MQALKNNIALVTGASRGVGRGIALSLGGAGATVYVTGRSTVGTRSTDGLPGTIDQTACEITARGGNGFAIKCDHTVDAEVERVFSRIRLDHGRLDLLVNNVWGGYEAWDGTSFKAAFWEQPPEYWHRMMAAGVRAHYSASRMAAPLMIEKRCGLIINISAGDRGIYLKNLMYDLAKNAIDRMAFGMAQELRDHNVAAVSLYPGFVRTERVAKHATPDQLKQAESPEYVGRAVVALSTDPDIMARTGQVLYTGLLAREFGFKDIDGRQPPPFRIDA